MLSKFARERRYPPAFYRRVFRDIPPEIRKLIEIPGREQQAKMNKLVAQLQNLSVSSEEHEMETLQLTEPKPRTSHQVNADDEVPGPSAVKVPSKKARAKKNQKKRRQLARKLAQIETKITEEGQASQETDPCEDIEKQVNTTGENVGINRILRPRRRRRGKKSKNKRRLQSESSLSENENNRNQPMPGMGGHHHQGMMMNGPRGNGPPMNGPPMNGPMGNPMGPHMMSSPNGPMHGPIPGPIPSPINNIGPSPMSGPMQGNGPINGPMMSPMGPMNNGGPLGPMNSPLNGPMNGPMNGPGPMNGMSSPMNGPMSNPINGMGGGMNSPMGGPSQCSMNHVSSNAGGMNNNFMMPMNNMYQKPLPVSAGKVYPADQPMVFNSQNPNAPPIYPCGVCHKEVHDNDQAILCESGCNFWFHRGCTGLTEAAFQLLTAEVYAEWVCDKCLASKNIPLVKFKP